jgi:hypothetical protein
VQTVSVRTRVALVRMPSGEPVAIDGRPYANVVEPARALSVSGREVEERQDDAQQTKAVLRPDRSNTTRSGGERVRALTKILGKLAGFAPALEPALGRWVAKISGLIWVDASRGHANRESAERVEEMLGFEVGHLPQRLRSRLVELGDLWVAVKKREDAAIQSCDSHAFGEAHHESVEISRQIINLLQSVS